MCGCGSVVSVHQKCVIVWFPHDVDTWQAELVRRRHRFETSRSQIADETSARVRAALLDYKKAFDLVDHNLLTAKLYNLGVRLTVVNWVADFLRDRYQRVELNFDCFSDFKPVPAGIPKGTRDWPTALFGYDQWPHNE